MTFRILAVCFASLCVFDACSGGSGSSAPSAPSTASHNANPPLLYSLGAATTQSTSTTTPPAGTLGLQSLDLTFTYTGQANAVLVYEVGYTGKFTVSSSCTTGPTVADRKRFATSAPTATASASAAATATATASATASAKPSPTASAIATASATPSASASASATPTASATATATASGPAAATATFAGSSSGTGPGSVLTVTAGPTGGTCQFTVIDSNSNTSVLFVGNTLTTGSVS